MAEARSSMFDVLRADSMANQFVNLHIDTLHDNAIYDDHGKLIGYVTEWKETTPSNFLRSIDNSTSGYIEVRPGISETDVTLRLNINVFTNSRETYINEVKKPESVERKDVRKNLMEKI